MSALVQPSEIHRLSIQDYHRMTECGGWDEGTHVELIDGLVVDMSPRSPEHENAIRWLIDWLFGAIDLNVFQLMVTGSLTIGESEPEPDIAILDREPPRREHPSHARLVVELAVSSQDRDLRSKPAVYAAAVDEYWVVDLQRSTVVVHRDPHAGAYRDVTAHPRPTSLAPTALTLSPVDTNALFAAAFAERQ